MQCPTNAIRIGMLNAWKVNGDYEIGRSKDESIAYPYNEKQRIISLYKKYFVNADKLLLERNIPLEY